MTREEVKKIVITVSALFPNWKPENPSAVVDSWAVVLADDSYEQISMALKQYCRVDSSGFAPTPGQLINMAVDIANHDALTDGEAWAMARKAIGDSTYHAGERFAELPPKIQAAFGTAEALKEWGSTEDYNEDVMRGQFLKLYHNAKEVKKTEQMYSPEVRKLIQNNLQNLLGKDEDDEENEETFD